MPFDGSGNFNRALGPATWQNDAAAGIKIKSDLHDNNDNDIANGLSNVICKDGQSSPTADIPLNGHKLINVANPVNPQDAATLSTLQSTVAARAVRYDVVQALTAPQKLQAQQNIDANRSTFQAKAGNYTAVLADSGTTLVFSATATLALTAAATLATGWWVRVIAPATGDLTIDPNGAELIDGVSAIAVRAGRSATIFCDGTRFVTSRVQNMGWELINALAPAGSAIAFTSLADFRRLRLGGIVIPSADSVIQLQVSTNNGSSYLNGAADYTTEWNYGTSANIQNSGAGNAVQVTIPIATAIAGQAYVFEQEFNNFNQAMVSRGMGRSNVATPAAGPHYIALTAAWLNGVVARNALRLQLSAGTYGAGTYISLEGMRG